MGSLRDVKRDFYFPELNSRDLQCFILITFDCSYKPTFFIDNPEKSISFLNKVHPSVRAEKGYPCFWTTTYLFRVPVHIIYEPCCKFIQYPSIHICFYVQLPTSFHSANLVWCKLRPETHTLPSHAFKQKSSRRKCCVFFTSRGITIMGCFNNKSRETSQNIWVFMRFGTVWCHVNFYDELLIMLASKCTRKVSGGVLVGCWNTLTVFNSES